MELQTFTIRQKSTNKVVGQIKFDEKGKPSVDLPENSEFIDAGYSERALGKILNRFHDSFGRLLPFEVVEDRVVLSKGKKFFIPGEDKPELIVNSFRNYILSLTPIFDIEEV